MKCVKCRPWLALGVLLGVSAMAVASVDRGVPVAAVKSVFLYRFVAFVDWPAERAPRGELVITVLGDDEVARELRAMGPALPRDGPALTVATAPELERVLQSHVLYVAAERHTEIRRWAAQLDGHPVLLVTAAPNGLALGSTINFLTEDGRVRFEVSVPAAQRAGLTLRAGLLQVAVSVHR